MAIALVSIVALAGCGSAGGGSAGPGPGAAVDVTPVYLTPGATTATLVWPPSEGGVDSYLVFESRNGSLYDYSTTSGTPSIEIAGNPGDSVQITVVAVSTTGQLSEQSPPSPPMIFQDAPAAAAIAALPAGPASPTAAPASAPGSVDPQTSNEAANADADSDRDVELANAEIDAPEATSLEAVAADVREMLLRADARLPEAELSNEARGWLQARVDAEMSAGVRLAGTGRRDDDALRELVWQDHAGQLFVSDGATALDATDLPATFEEALRLGATERFVGLADLDGDGLGDWLVEDTATADVFVIDGATQSEFDTRGVDDDAALAGLGDFDGDGRSEVLWKSQNGALDLSRPTADAPALADDAQTPEHFELLAIADFDGDGRDDLLGRNDEGELQVGTANTADDDGPIRFDWANAGNAPADGSELVATLDVDGDGRAELAWFDVMAEADDEVTLRDVTP